MALTVLCIAAVFCVTAACSKNRKNDSDTTTTTTATAEVKSPNKAIATIKQYLNKNELDVLENYYYIPQEAVMPVLVTDSEKSEDYNYWQVTNPDQYKVIFLFDNDQNAISADNNSNRDYISDDYVMDIEFKNAEYNNSGAFAWNCKGSSNAVLGKKAGFKCSSIWAFDETSSTISMIWYDTESEAWQNFQ